MEESKAVDAAPAEGTPAVDRLSELETMTWRMYGERLEKLQLQLLVMQNQQQAVLAEKQAAEMRLDALKRRMRLAYGLRDQDKLNLETGDILRGPDAPPQDAN